MLPILNQSFWRDEAFSVLLSEKSPVQIISLTIRDQSPPFYYFLLHYWMLFFGQSEVAVRGLSFVFHIGIVLMVFLIAQKLTKSLFPSLLMAIATLLNPFLLQYAFEARPYSLLAFTTTAAVYGIVRKNYWIAAIMIALGILTHNFGLFTCTAIGIWWVYTHRLNWKTKIKEGVTLLSFPAITLAVWGGVIWNQWERVGKGFWIKPATSAIFLESLQKYMQGDIGYPSANMLYLLSFILFFVSISYWLWKREKEPNTIPLLLFSVAFVPILITYIISALFAPIYHERYLIATAPLLILLIGYSLYQTFLSSHAKKMLLTAGISAYMTVLLLSSEQLVGITTKPAINWGVQQIIAEAQPGDIVIPKDALNYLETKFYLETNKSTLPVYAYSPTGTIPFYIGAILFDKDHILTQIPTDKRVWEVMPDGGYMLLEPKGQ